MVRYRDSLLATLLDGVRSTGNHNVHVKMNPTPRGKRLIPFNALPEEEVNFLKIISFLLDELYLTFFFAVGADSFEISLSTTC